MFYDCADQPQDIPIEKLIIHEDYKQRGKNVSNDIALIRLSEAANFSDFVRPICMPPNELLSSARLTEMSPYSLVSGWGIGQESKALNFRILFLLHQ